MSPRLLIAFVCLVNLVAGTGLGVILDRTTLAEKHKRPEFGHMLEKRLDLDADQAKKVHDIFAAHRHQFEEATRDARKQTDDEIRAILRPDQIEKFDDFKKEMRSRRERGAASVNSDTNTGKDGR
jgi:hypothetical protein